MIQIFEENDNVMITLSTPLTQAEKALLRKARSLASLNSGIWNIPQQTTEEKTERQICTLFDED